MDQPEQERDLLPSRTLKVYNFVIQYKIDHDGNSPSNRQIMTGVGLKTPSNVRYHLAKLIKLGLITGPGGSPTWRSLELAGGSWQPPKIWDFFKGKQQRRD